MLGLDEFGFLKFLVKWFSAIKLSLQKKFSIGLCYFTGNERNIPEEITLIPKSVNYHFTRRCNYECGFCFHTAKTSFVLPIEEAKKGLLMLKEAGMEKINFSGGEPLIEDRGRYLGELARFCKVNLRLPSVSIVTNASLLYKSWFTAYGEFIDIVAVSCDSFDEQTNVTIGRGKGRHLVQLEKAASWCREHDILFKINTVVCSANVHEDMSENISLLNPCRWKVFQCLVLEGENAGPDALRNAEKLQISDEEFQAFVTRHQHLPCIVPESNQKMKDSYLILDEYMRFLNCQEGKKEPSPSIIDVGVDKALSKAGFDEEMFRKRGGIYKWSKPQSPLDW